MLTIRRYRLMIKDSDVMKKMKLYLHLNRSAFPALLHRKPTPSNATNVALECTSYQINSLTL